MPGLTLENDLIRSQYVAASEVGALIERHPYATPESIFDRLYDPTSYQRPEQSEAMTLGSYFEPYIARYAARKLGVRIRGNSRTLVARDLPLCATPDYFVLGQRMLIECKLSSKMYAWADEEAMQPYIVWQARAQMLVTDRDVCIVAALVGSAFHLVPIVRDAEKEGRLSFAVRRFWNDHILTGIRPVETTSRITQLKIER